MGDSNSKCFSDQRGHTSKAMPQAVKGQWESTWKALALHKVYIPLTLGYSELSNKPPLLVSSRYRVKIVYGDATSFSLVLLPFFVSHRA